MSSPAPRTPALRVVLPLPPSFNSAWRAFAYLDEDGELKARNILSEDARKWKKAAGAELARRTRLPALASPTAVLELHLVVYVPSISSDATNRVKLVEDALAEAGHIDNDRCNVRILVEKKLDARRPRVELEVKLADHHQHAEVLRRLQESDHNARRREAKERMKAQQEPLALPTRPSSASRPGSGPGALTYGKRHGLDKLRQKARPASYPAKHRGR